jgi:aromatic-L-amino-acid/L-tryptophan decarboxylase
MMTNFDLTPADRKKLLEFVFDKLDAYYRSTKSYNVSPSLNLEEILKKVGKNDLEDPVEPQKAIHDIIDGLEKFSVHTPHPKYFGLFNPRTNFASILGDFITAVFNPQIAAWSHAPYAAEIENRIIHEFGIKFGYPADKIDGVFATGGAEANLTALLCALNHAFPDLAKGGVFGLTKRPMIYCSTEAHHSIDKAAKIAGLGYSSVKEIRVDDKLKMDPENLKQAILKDLDEGNQPLMVIGTAGTTGVGAIDYLPALGKISDEFSLWYHVDAAWGGGAILNKQLHSFLKGIEQADSITFDAHKWMSLPMGTSMYLTSDTEILGKTFRITTEYMPKEASDLEITDPFTHSIQWSRRFNGLKVWLSLQIFGWEGYDEIIGIQTKTGEYLKQRLRENGWSIKNDTPLPVVCFTDGKMESDMGFAKTIAQNIVNSGKSWISVYPVSGIPTLRACITNYNTTEEDIEELVKEVNDEREKYNMRR